MDAVVIGRIAAQKKDPAQSLEYGSRGALLGRRPALPQARKMLLAFEERVLQQWRLVELFRRLLQVEFLDEDGRCHH
jgi:hypothetical protein